MEINHGQKILNIFPGSVEQPSILRFCLQTVSEKQSLIYLEILYGYLGFL